MALLATVSNDKSKRIMQDTFQRVSANLVRVPTVAESIILELAWKKIVLMNIQRQVIGL